MKSLKHILIRFVLGVGLFILLIGCGSGDYTPVTTCETSYVNSLNYFPFFTEGNTWTTTTDKTLKVTGTKDINELKVNVLNIDGSEKYYWKTNSAVYYVGSDQTIFNTPIIIATSNDCASGKETTQTLSGTDNGEPFIATVNVNNY